MDLDGMLDDQKAVFRESEGCDQDAARDPVNEQAFFTPRGHRNAAVEEGCPCTAWNGQAI